MIEGDTLARPQAWKPNCLGDAKVPKVIRHTLLDNCVLDRWSIILTISMDKHRSERVQEVIGRNSMCSLECGLQFAKHMGLVLFIRWGDLVVGERW